MRFKMVRIISGLVITLLFSSIASAQTPGSMNEKSADEASVRQTVQTFVDAWTDIDADKAKTPLYEQAILFKKQGGSVSQANGRKLYKNLQDGDKIQWPLGFENKILYIDVDGEVASAKVQRRMPRTRIAPSSADPRSPTPDVVFTEYFSLMKLREGWRVMSVVTSIEERPAI